MLYRSLVVENKRLSRARIRQLAGVLGLAGLMLPGLAGAQTTLPFKDVLFVERGILSYPTPNDADTSKYHNESDGFHFCDQYYGHNGR